MLSRRESELNADAVTVICRRCRDEYIAYVLWIARDTVVEREKECACPVLPEAESRAIAEHYDPPEPPESDWFPQYQIGGGGVFS